MKNQARILTSILIALGAFLFTAVAFAGVDTGTDDNDVILNGYDAVAYFTDGHPVEGSAQFTASHGGAVYRFANAKNRDTFRANPAKYAPAFGGYCAYGTALGKKFAVNGRAFEVVNGVLYVNKNEGVYDTWKKDKKDNISKADKNWPKIRKIAAEDL